MGEETKGFEKLTQSLSEKIFHDAQLDIISKKLVQKISDDLEKQLSEDINSQSNECIDQREQGDNVGDYVDHEEHSDLNEQDITQDAEGNELIFDGQDFKDLDVSDKSERSDEQNPNAENDIFSTKVEGCSNKELIITDRFNANVESAGVACSTPVKKGLARRQGLPKDEKLPLNTNLSSNLAVMIGDLSSIDNGMYADDISLLSLEQLDQVEAGKGDGSDMPRPSTLSLSDLDNASVDSYKYFSSQDTVTASSLVNGQTITSLHDESINALQKWYEKEIRRMQLEKEEVLALTRSPRSNVSLLRMKYLEGIKLELEERCHQAERRNKQLTVDVDRLNRSCYALERKVELLEADKAVLQERSFRVNQDRQKSIQDITALQERLGDSVSSQRLLEDELLRLKKKELTTSSRLDDSDVMLRELREDLNCSKRDCADKDRIIQNVTSQRKEIQENLNEALEQISRLEDASSQRAREKNLFHKLLEEYEVLYSQHRRIRDLYNEALQKLDESIEDEQINRSTQNSRLSLKIPSRNTPLRKKWSMSPTSPSIREQDDSQSSPKRSTGASGNHVLDHVHRGSSHSNRHSTGSILAWETASELNNNNNTFQDGEQDEPNSLMGKRSHTKWFEKRLSYNGNRGEYEHEEERNPVIQSKEMQGNLRQQREWVVQNMNGITRFDVVFSPPKSRYQQAEKDYTEGSRRHKMGTDKDQQNEVTEDDRGRDSSAEILELENDLKKLSAEKNEIESQLNRMPRNGSGRSRRVNAEKQELLEERLDEVNKYIGNIRMILKRHKVL